MRAQSKMLDGYSTMLTATKVHRRHLRKIMADRGMKAVDIAKILGIRPQTVRAYMCGTRQLRKVDYEKVVSAIRA